MPELPEVETVARLIRPRLLGRRIERVEVNWPRSVEGCSPRSFASRLRGAGLLTEPLEALADYVVTRTG